MTAPAGRRSGHGADSAFAQMSESEGARRGGGRARNTHTILVVDDHDSLRYAARKVLERAGFKTLEAPTGSDGIAAAGKADAVLLDVHLPDVNGVQVLKSIRQSRPRLPIVLTSAIFVDDVHRTAGLDAGADAYLVAPVDHELLVSTLDRVLGTGPS